MKDPIRLLRALTLFCWLAFLGFAIAGLAFSDQKDFFHATATAFLASGAIGFAAGQAFSQQSRKLQEIQIRLRAIEERNT